MSKLAVVAIGGNALLIEGQKGTIAEQIENALDMARQLAKMIKLGWRVIVTHGNGPQVGMINLAMDVASKSSAATPEMPFPECGAMSQGYIGYHLQNAIREELLERDMQIPVATVVTQVIVDKNDSAFENPTKPVGAFYSKEEAEKLMTEKGFVMKEDAGRGYRRVVASPLPIDVAEKETIKTLVDNNQVVIAVGGGGIPVYAEGNKLIGIPAVIDKDFASAKLAEILDADYLIILTAVEQVAINFGKENEQWLSTLTINEAEKYIEEGHFAPGSMLPKVKAAISFAESKEGRKALITSLEKASAGIAGQTGTRIVK